MHAVLQWKYTLAGLLYTTPWHIQSLAILETITRSLGGGRTVPLCFSPLLHPKQTDF